MQFPTSTKWSVISLIFITTILVGPMAYANHQNKLDAHSHNLPGLAWADTHEESASARVTPSIPSQNSGKEQASPALALTVTTPAPQEPSELVDIVAYIAQVFEPEGKEVVVQAINCFYSESGLRSNAVGQNSDGPRSKDWNVAQLNDYWHNLTEEEKTNYKANIDRAYEIYKGRGNFSAWYGKRCN